MLTAEKEEKPVGCFLKIKQAHHDDFPADYYKAKYACEGCLRRKPLLKHGRKPTVSVSHGFLFNNEKQLVGSVIDKKNTTSKYSCEGCLRRKPLLKHGRKPTVSVALAFCCFENLNTILGPFDLFATFF